MKTKLKTLELDKSQFARMSAFQEASLTDHCRVLGHSRGLAIGYKHAEGFRACRIHGYMPDFKLLP